MPATARQTWALFCATGLDCRNLVLSKEYASSLIDRCKSEKDKVIQDLLDMGATGKAKSNNSWPELHSKADAAGRVAATQHSPQPMIVQQHANMLDDNSPVVKEYFVSDGVCGFAWINIRPGNCSYALWAKKNLGARKGYYGGMELWVRDFGQSYERKHAYATAYANVLKEYGIKAYAGGRLD